MTRSNSGLAHERHGRKVRVLWVAAKPLKGKRCPRPLPPLKMQFDVVSVWLSAHVSGTVFNTVAPGTEPTCVLYRLIGPS